MAKFFVKIKEVHSQIIEVDAPDEAAALVIAEQCLSTGLEQNGDELENDADYDYTLPVDEWTVFQ